jgi:hypothetical protein
VEDTKYQRESERERDRERERKRETERDRERGRQREEKEETNVSAALVPRSMILIMFPIFLFRCQFKDKEWMWAKAR